MWELDEDVSIDEGTCDEWADLVDTVQEALEEWWDDSRTAAVVRSYCGA